MMYVELFRNVKMLNSGSDTGVSGTLTTNAVKNIFKSVAGAYPDVHEDGMCSVHIQLLVTDIDVSFILL